MVQTNQNNTTPANSESKSEQLKAQMQALKKQIAIEKANERKAEKANERKAEKESDKEIVKEMLKQINNMTKKSQQELQPVVKRLEMFINDEKYTRKGGDK